MNIPNSLTCYIIGDDSLVIRCSEILLKENIELLGIISNNPLIRNWGERNNIPMIDSIKSLLIYNASRFDYLFSIVNNQILCKEVLALPRCSAINFHNAPLPKYAGLLATTWAILNNEKTHAITWHLMNEKIDAGDIVKQSTFNIDENETTLSLNLKCYEHAVQSFQELVTELKENKVIRKKQNLYERSYYGSSHQVPNNGFISWHQSAEKISLLCRALTFGNYPNPLGNPKWILRDKIFTVKSHQILLTRENELPGTIISISENSLNIATKTNSIALLTIAYDNNEIITISDLIKKFKIKPGDRLQSVNSRCLVSRHEHENDLKRFFIMKSSEKNKILHSWAQNKIKYNHKKTVCKIFEEQVVRDPNAIAAMFEGKSITYQELNNKSNQFAYHLLERGIQAETLVAICVERSLDMLIAILGILKAGAAYLPLEPSYPIERLAYMMKDSKAPLLIINHLNIRDKFKNFTSEILNFQSVLKISSKDKKNPKISTQPNQRAYVIYTSGTTGVPKGVEITHRSLHNHMTWMQREFGFDKHDIFFQKTPFSFDASVWEFFIPWYVGGKLVIAPANAHADPHQLIDLMTKNKITTLQVVPTILKELLNIEKFKDCSHLKRVFCGGETLFPNTIKEFFEKMPIKLYNLYGPTEATIDATSLQCTVEHGKISASLIGKPIANAEVYVLDKEMQIMPIGAPGELYIGGDCIARGYLNKFELTKEKFVSNPFKDNGTKLYKTGDLVQWQIDGNLEYLGRCDDQVKIRGCRVEPNEVEEQLSKFPLVQQSIVIPKTDAQGCQILVGYILPKKNSQITVQDLKNFLKKSLPPYMIPNIFYIVDKFITTPSGKIDRKNFSKCVLLSTHKSENPPKTYEEKILANIFESVLNEKFIGIHDNFFDLGGNSLIFLKVSALIEEKLSTKLSIGKLFELPTIAELAKAISKKINNPSKNEFEIKKSSLIRLHKGGNNTPLFLIHPIGGGIFWYKDLAKYIDKNRSLYAIQDPGIETKELLFQSIEEMAAFYISIIQTVQAHGPYLLGGASFGATIAIEMAKQLLEKGEKIPFIALLDGWSSYHALASDKDYFKNFMHEQNKKTFTFAFNNGNIHSNFLLKLQWHREKLLTNYTTPCLNTKLTLFKAQELWRIFKENEPLNGWRNYSTLPIERHIVPGNHETMFYEPHVKILAEKLNKCLELCNSNKTPIHHASIL